MNFLFTVMIEFSAWGAYLVAQRKALIREGCLFLFDKNNNRKCTIGIVRTIVTMFRPLGGGGGRSVDINIAYSRF